MGRGHVGVVGDGPGDTLDRKFGLFFLGLVWSRDASGMSGEGVWPLGRPKIQTENFNSFDFSGLVSRGPALRVARPTDQNQTEKLDRKIKLFFILSFEVSGTCQQSFRKVDRKIRPKNQTEKFKKFLSVFSLWTIFENFCQSVWGLMIGEKNEKKKINFLKIF